MPFEIDLCARRVPPKAHSVLVIEDDADVRENLVELLEAEGFAASGAGDGARGLAMASEAPPSVVLCDLRMPVLDGYGVLREIRARSRTRAVPFIFLSAASDREHVREGMRLGADDFVTKPFARRDVLGAIRSRLRAVEPPPAKVVERLDPPVVVDPASRALFELAERAAATSLPVLVVGEAGAGKGVVARHVHAASGDPEPLALASGPTLALPFDHQLPRGRRTLLLDAIDEVPVAAQRELLGVLDERARGGARLLATARGDLAAAAREGRFRPDLLHRLEGFVLAVPPLRERPGDVLPLAARALERVGRGAALSAEAAAALARHRFPGNVRELESRVERAAVLADGGLVRPEHLGLGPEPAPKAERRAPAEPRGPRPSPFGRGGLPPLRGRR